MTLTVSQRGFPYLLPERDNRQLISWYDDLLQLLPIEDPASSYLLVKQSLANGPGGARDRPGFTGFSHCDKSAGEEVSNNRIGAISKGNTLTSCKYVEL